MTLNIPQGVLNLRVFNPQILQLHINQFMLGQTSKFIDKDKCILDIGAAVGMYSYFWSDKCTKVYAFEAVEPVYKQLVNTSEKAPGIIIPRNVAVGAFSGKTTFYVDDKRLSNSSMNDLVNGQKIEIDVIKIDDLNLDEPVGFMKIDVEGFELDVLKGASDLINDQKPAVMCEIYEKFNNGPVEDTFDFFFVRGYKCFCNLKNIGLVPVHDVKHGKKMVSEQELIRLTDGDFLFINEE